MNRSDDRIQQTSGCEVLLEVGDPVAVERVDRRRVQVIRRHVAEDAVKAENGENSVGQLGPNIESRSGTRLGHMPAGGRGRR